MRSPHHRPVLGGLSLAIALAGASCALPTLPWLLPPAPAATEEAPPRQTPAATIPPRPMSTPTPRPATPTPVATLSPLAVPYYDPEIGACRNVPEAPTAGSPGGFDPQDHDWQVAAPRGAPGRVLPGDLVTIGLRDGSGSAGEVLQFSARVQRPDGTASTLEAALVADQWTYLHYPQDFPMGSTRLLGTYTILYQVSGVIVACDGFVVEPYG